jgi:dCMP deaminase
MKPKMAAAYMATARIFAELSHARRLHVGAIVVKEDRIISIGYNGMPAGWDNDCEYKEYINVSNNTGEFVSWDFDQQDENGTMYRLRTRPEVLHAESNAVSKLARSSESGDGSTMFVTHAPCLDCAKLIYQSGIRRLFYGEDYREDTGVSFLRQCGVDVSKID